MGSEGVAVASVIAEGRMALEGSVMEVGLASAETMEELAGSQAACTPRFGDGHQGRTEEPTDLIMDDLATKNKNAEAKVA